MQENWEGKYNSHFQKKKEINIDDSDWNMTFCIQNILGQFTLLAQWDILL